jgi:hypothetical protein
MLTAIPSVGTPAYRYALNWSPSYWEKTSWRLKKAAAWVSEVTFGCSHRHITLPYNDHQTCLDYGASRLYLFHADFEHAQAGVFKGRWKKSTSPTSVNCIAAERLIDDHAHMVNRVLGCTHTPQHLHP